MLGKLPRHEVIGLLALLFISLWLRGFELWGSVGTVLAIGFWMGIRIAWASRRKTN
jgi:hypothetical protein